MLLQKYKPKDVNSFIGDRIYIDTVFNALNQGYRKFLFVGGTGTGKTSFSEVVCKYLLCDNKLVNRTPCGQCVSCISFDTGTNPKLVRDIFFGLDEIEYADIVFLDDMQNIDGHMKSMLSDVKNKIIFVCASSEKENFNCLGEEFLTIYFKYPSTTDLSSLLEKVCVQENFMFEPSVLISIATETQGNVCRALNIIDQLRFLGGITQSNFRKIFFKGEEEFFSKLFLNLDQREVIYNTVILLAKRFSIDYIYNGLSKYALDAYCIDGYDTILRNRFGKRLVAFSKQMTECSKKAISLRDIICDLLLLELLVSTNTIYREISDKAILSKSCSRVERQKHLIKRSIREEKSVIEVKVSPPAIEVNIDKVIRQKEVVVTEICDKIVIDESQTKIEDNSEYSKSNDQKVSLQELASMLGVAWEPIKNG